MPGNSRNNAKIRAAVAKDAAQLDRGEGIEYTDELLNTMTRADGSAVYRRWQRGSGAA
jgi:hypothetical protein